MKLKEYRESGIVISTVAVPFLAWYGPYETGISVNSQKSFSIAEGYTNEDEAREGHLKYCNMSDEEIRNIKFIG